MNRLPTALIVLITYAFLSSVTFAEEDKHGHDHEEGQKETEKHDDHAEHDESGEHGGHSEDDENSQVGVDKGILEASEKYGIKLSPEAEKTFAISKVKVSALGPTEIPRNAIVTALAEVNIFRFRNGFYSRIDFEQVSRTQDRVLITSKDLRIGDEIVVSGTGFLRVAEIAAFGGAPTGHSH